MEPPTESTLPHRFNPLAGASGGRSWPARGRPRLAAAVHVLGVPYVHNRLTVGSAMHRPNQGRWCGTASSRVHRRPSAFPAGCLPCAWWRPSRGLKKGLLLPRHVGGTAHHSSKPDLETGRLPDPEPAHRVRPNMWMHLPALTVVDFRIVDPNQWTAPPKHGLQRPLSGEG